MTIKQIATAAGVSPATVSNVINGKGGVSDKTREAILAIVKQHNYIPSAKKKTGTSILFLKYRKHGMLVEENQGFISSIIDRIELECRARQHSLSILLSDDALEATLMQLDYTQYAGIFVLATELEREQYRLLDSIPIPYVAIDNNMPHFPCCAVGINNRENVHKALGHIAACGYREIAYFASSIQIENFAERSASVYEYAGQLGLEFDPRHDYRLTPTLVGAYEDMKRHLEHAPALPACAFADNDSIAVGAMKALKEAGYRIPEDLAVVGFDDIPYASIHSPTLTTISVPKEQIAAMAVHQLCLMLENAELREIKLQLTGQLVVRDSTTAP